MKILKQLFSLILPFTVTVIVPISIGRDATFSLTATPAIGLAIVVAGLSLIALTISMFVRIGRGTLAPWSPTQKLVVVGIYRYVRNPMISGVLLVLWGECLCMKSIRIFAWALIFFAINHVYFILSEEPGLEKRFGEEYRVYKQNVPRWIPRLTPFQPVK